MAMKLNVGLNKKLGLPDYGSLGASCHLELELDQSILQDPDGFQERVRRTFNACRQAVDDELARRSPGARLNPRSPCRPLPPGSMVPTGPAATGTMAMAIGPVGSNSTTLSSWPAKSKDWESDGWSPLLKRCSPNRWPIYRAWMPRG